LTFRIREKGGALPGRRPRRVVVPDRLRSRVPRRCGPTRCGVSLGTSTPVAVGARVPARGHAPARWQPIAATGERLRCRGVRAHAGVRRRCRQVGGVMLPRRTRPRGRFFRRRAARPVHPWREGNTGAGTWKHLSRVAWIRGRPHRLPAGSPQAVIALMWAELIGKGGCRSGGCTPVVGSILAARFCLDIPQVIAR